MREIVFRVVSQAAGRVEAEAELPALERSLTISAPSLEELHHEARDALIEHLGPAHAAYRVRIRRSHPQPLSGIQRLRRPSAPRC